MPKSNSAEPQPRPGTHAPGGRGLAILAWSACAVGVGSLTGGAILEEVSGTTDPAESLFERFALLVGFGALPSMGALVASRYPRNPIGWMFLAVGAGIGVMLLAGAYAHWALAQASDSYPGATLAAWFEQWLWAPSVGLLFTLILLLFADGRPPSRRWRWLVWASATCLAVVALGGMLEQRLEGGDYSIDNPIGVPGLDDVESETIIAPFFALFIPLVVLCAASLVVRWRRSRGDERQQLKLVTFSGCIVVVSIVAGDYLEVPGTFAVALLLLVTSVAVAMLKYRLYDIDRVVNNTVVRFTSRVQVGAA